MARRKKLTWSMDKMGDGGEANFKFKKADGPYYPGKNAASGAIESTEGSFADPINWAVAGMGKLATATIGEIIEAAQTANRLLKDNNTKPATPQVKPEEPVPYLKSRTRPKTKEEEVYESFLTPETKARKNLERTTFYKPGEITDMRQLDNKTTWSISK